MVFYVGGFACCCCCCSTIPADFSKLSNASSQPGVTVVPLYFHIQTYSKNSLRIVTTGPHGLQPIQSLFWLMNAQPRLFGAKVTGLREVSVSKVNRVNLVSLSATIRDFIVGDRIFPLFQGGLVHVALIVPVPPIVSHSDLWNALKRHQTFAAVVRTETDKATRQKRQEAALIRWHVAGTFSERFGHLQDPLGGESAAVHDIVTSCCAPS